MEVSILNTGKGNVTDPEKTFPAAADPSDTKLVAKERKPKRARELLNPDPPSVATSLLPFGSTPRGARLALAVVPELRSLMKTSATPLVSPVTKFVDVSEKETKRPLTLRLGSVTDPFPAVPSGAVFTLLVDPLDKLYIINA